jgi:hypothetical protein
MSFSNWIEIVGAGASSAKPAAGQDNAAASAAGHKVKRIRFPLPETERGCCRQYPSFVQFSFAVLDPQTALSILRGSRKTGVLQEHT